MMDILLPILDGWTDNGFKIDRPVNIQKGSQFQLEQFKFPGLLYSFDVSVKGDVLFILKWWDRRERRYKSAEVDPKTLLESGYDEPNAAAPWVVNFDEVNNVYEVAFTPATPLPIYASQDHPRYLISKAVDSDITILGYTQEAIIIYDRDAYVNSLREIISPFSTLKR